MGSILDSMAEEYCRANFISEKDKFEAFLVQLHANYLPNNEECNKRSLEQIAQYYDEDIAHFLRCLLIDKLPLDQYKPLVKSLRLSSRRFQSKMELFAEINYRKLRKRSQKLLYEDRMKIEDVLEECNELEQYDLGLAVMEELTKQQIIKHPIFSFYYQNFLY